MKNFIHKNMKLIISACFLIGCAICLITTNEWLIQMQPDITELHVVSHNLEDEIYHFSYTGKIVTPKLERLVLADFNGKTMVVYDSEISDVKYNNNTKIGDADMEISLKGYQGSLLIEDAFRILPEKVQSLETSVINDEAIELSWKKVHDADGYLVYKKITKNKKSDSDFILVGEIVANESLTYYDTDLQQNALFEYYVCAYKEIENKQYVSEKSDVIEQYTPLDKPEIAAITSLSGKALQLIWYPVAGAKGFQIYRSLSVDGEYTCIGEVIGNNTTIYTDKTCECGVEYFYYIKTGQLNNDVMVYGDESPVKSGRAMPNMVKLSGVSEKTKITLSWDKSLGAHGYEIYRSKNSASDFEYLTTIDSENVLTWSEDGLDEYTDFCYQIRPYCLTNGTMLYGPFSNIADKGATINYNYGGGNGADVLRQYIGRSYVWGGTSPSKGWDCSGFSQWAFKTHFGVELPRTAAQQSKLGTTVDKNDRSTWMAGDLIFYKKDNGAGPVGHVAIYLGNGEIIHALNEDLGTIIQNVDAYEKWDSNKLYCVKRFFDTKVE